MSSIQRNPLPSTQMYRMISDRKAQRIARIIPEMNLVSLTIRGPSKGHGLGLSHVGAKMILDATQGIPSLTKLDLQGNPGMGDEAAKVISVWLQNHRTIQVLNLSGCGLTDVGIMRLVPGLLESPSLRRLCVNNNTINESWLALKSIAKIAQITLY
jgi:Leucine-rich repeat (LRR) protein